MSADSIKRRRPAAILLVLVRHGEAGTASRDEIRELTREGRRTIRMLSAELQSRTFSPVVIRTSPLKRAHQTAETIFSALPEPGPVLPTNALASGTTVDNLLGLLGAEKPGTSALWVGHMPDLGQFAARLLDEPGGVGFRPGTAVALRVIPGPEPAGSLAWTWNPD